MTLSHQCGKSECNYVLLETGSFYLSLAGNSGGGGRVASCRIITVKMCRTVWAARQVQQDRDPVNHTLHPTTEQNILQTFQSQYKL